MHNLRIIFNKSSNYWYCLLIILGLLIYIPEAFCEIKSVEKIKSLLQNRLGSAVTIKEVKSTPLVGLYEVNLGNQIIYTDTQVRYLIQGYLIDLDRGENLTEMRLSEINRVKFSDFPFEQAITAIRGSGQRKLVIFADPNCGYCKRLEQSLQSINNLTTHTFLVPILSTDSIRKTKQIWCTVNRNQVWQDWALRNISPVGDEKCDSPIEKNIALANKLNVRATPVLFFSDGSRMSGAMPVDVIERKLSEVK